MNESELAAKAARLGLWAWDADNNRIWATDTARAMFGITNGDPISIDRLVPLIHAEDAPRVREGLRQALARDGDYSLQFRICLPNGPTRWVGVRGNSKCATPGKGPVLRGILLDVTDQRQVQDEADQLRHELVHAGRVTMMGQLASALAHELKQPLAAILRNAEAAELLLGRAPPDLDELRAIVSDIHADDRRATEVIDRLRVLLKHGQMELQPIAVASLIQDASALVRFDAAARHVTLELAIDSALPPIAGDRVQLSQVLVNLIINGMDATAESTDSRRRVLVEARAGRDHCVELAVTDSGTGIPPERMKRIFEPFFTTKAGGMGMGLAVSRKIIEAHGGRLWAQNCARGGATFCFALPAAEDSSP